MSGDQDANTASAPSGGRRSRYAFYSRDGDLIVPNKAAGGPWSPTLQSGHALAPLLGTLLASVPALVPMVSVRLAMNLTRPVPMAPLQALTVIQREGRKLQVLQTSLQRDAVSLADLTVVRAREGQNDTPLPPRRYPGPERGELLTGTRFPRSFEFRGIPGTRRAGGATVWMRLGVDVFPGEPASPLAHALCLADFGSGLGALFDHREWNYPNFELTLHLFREPVGEWLLLDCDTETAGLGIALVSGVLADEQGVFGHSRQSVLVDRIAVGSTGA